MNLALVISQGIVAVAAVLTLLVLLLRGALSTERRLATLEARVPPLAEIERRVANLETKIEPFWDAIRQHVVPSLQGLKPPGNPISSERWQALLSKLQYNTLSVAEARELNAAFLEQQAEAKKKNDLAVLIAIGLGLALLAVMLKEK